MRFVKIMCPCKREHYKRVQDNKTIRVEDCEHTLMFVDLDSDTHVRRLCKECKNLLDVVVEDEIIKIKTLPYGEHVETTEATVVIDES